MDPRPSRVDTFEATRIQGPEWFFTYYHPERPPYQMDQYAFFLIDEYEGIEESRYNFSSTNFLTGLDPAGGCLALEILGRLEHDHHFFAQHAATIPPGKMSTYSEFMPHLVAPATTVSLKQDVRVATQPQPCVSPALCQGHADLPEYAEFDDELDCPGELAADFDAESADEEDEDSSHPPPSPSPFSSPSSSSGCCEPPSTLRAVRSGRGKNRYSPMEIKAPRSSKGKSPAKRRFNSDEPKKTKKRREAVSLACHFCRRRKIACRQPPPGSLDRTCHQCKTRGLSCDYPTESHRGARRGPANSIH